MTDKSKSTAAPAAEVCMQPQTLIFPANLAGDAQNGATHVRININERIADGFVSVATLHLNYPIGFAVTDSGNYGSGDFGSAVLGFNTFLKGIGMKEAGGTKVTTQDIVSQRGAISDLVSNIPGVDLAAKGMRIAAMEQGIAQNPFTYVTYEGQQLRTFTMDFKMISESPEEAETIKQIVDLVRKYSMPEASGSLSIQYPAFFEIEFYQGEEVNKFMPKIFQCHLTSLGTVYNATSNIFHADGAPLETDMSLSFQEQKSLTREDLYPKDGGEGEDEGNIIYTEADPVDDTDT